MNILATVGLAALCVAIGGEVRAQEEVRTFQADKADTATLWQLPEADRLAADKARRGEYYANRIKFFLEENATTATKGGTVFVGASGVERCPLDMAFPGKAVYNRGIGGDRIEGVLERLDCTVIALAPKEIFVMVGSNDVTWPADYRKGNLRIGYERLFRALKAVAPQARIVATSLTPIDKRADRLGTCIEELRIANGHMRDVAEEMGLEYIDLYAKLVSDKGLLRPGLASDGVHFSLAGYVEWFDMLGLELAAKFEMWRNIAPHWALYASDTCAITGRNEYRAMDSLILYRSDADTTRPSTRTNEWGWEVMVRDDTVTSAASIGNMRVPKAPGYVLSGIGPQKDWLVTHAHIGAKLKLAGDAKSVSVKLQEPTTPEEWYRHCRSRFLIALSKHTNPDELRTMSDELEQVRLGKLEPHEFEGKLNRCCF